jgi:hypothetical protein
MKRGVEIKANDGIQRYDLTRQLAHRDVHRDALVLAGARGVAPQAQAGAEEEDVEVGKAGAKAEASAKEKDVEGTALSATESESQGDESDDGIEFS